MQNEENQNILITGAGGAIGKGLTKYLLEKTNYRLTLSYYSASEIPTYTKKYPDRITIVVGDISQQIILDTLFNNISTVIHLASSVSPNNYNQDWNNAYKFGADSTFAILDYIKNTKNKIHLIFPSSGGTVYSKKQNIPFVETDIANGVSPYGIQKVMFENYLKLLTGNNKNISCNILRISNPYGLPVNSNRKQGFIDIIIQKILNNEPIELYSPVNTIRDYIYIDDLCSAFLKAIEYKNGLEIFNIGSGNGNSLTDVINNLENLLNKKISYKQVQTNYYYPQYNVLDIKKANSILNWEPEITLKQGLKLLIKNYTKEEKCLKKN